MGKRSAQLRKAKGGKKQRSKQGNHREIVPFRNAVPFLRPFSLKHSFHRAILEKRRYEAQITVVWSRFNLALKLIAAGVVLCGD